MNRSSVRFSSLGSAAATLALGLLAVSSATAAPITFAQYIQGTGAQQWTVSSTGGTTTVTATGTVWFTYLVASPFSAPEKATFTLTATSAQIGNCGVACGAGDSYVQPGYVGTFSFIDAGSATGANLLSGTFAVTGSPATTGAQFSSSIGSSGGSFNASATAGNLGQLVLTSGYLSFSGSTQEDASWSLSSLIPNFATGTVTGGDQAYPASATSFNSAASGTFSSSTVTPTPEPTTLSLIGGALIGLGLLRRKSTSRQ